MSDLVFNRRSNVRVVFDDPKRSFPRVRLQYKFKILGVFPVWVTVQEKMYFHTDHPSPFKAPFEYAKKMCREGGKYKVLRISNRQMKRNFAEANQ